MRGSGRGISSAGPAGHPAQNGVARGQPDRGARRRLAPVIAAACLLLAMGLGSGPATAVADPAAALAAARGAGANDPAAPRARIATPTPTPLPSPWPLPAAALQTRLDSLRLRYGVPGVSVTIIWPDGRTWTGVSGWANLSRRVPVVSGTAFAVGSVTKTFVSALVLQLAAEGKFRLDDRVRTYLPTAKVNTGVTIRQMLNHTSGTYDFFSNPRIDTSILANKRRVWSESRSLSYVLGAYFHSGRGWHYSNTNYVQLGQLVRAVTGHSVGAEIRRRFLDPLGLGRTFMQGSEAKRGTVATAYVVSGSGSTLRRVSLADGTSIAPFTSVTTAAGSAGAIASSSRDLAVWARALYSGDVLDADSIAAMEDVTASVAHDSWVPYGLGFMDESLGGRETFGHSGRLIGARASMRYLPATGFTIAVVTNQDRTNPDTFGTALMNIIKPDTWVTPGP